MSRPADPRWAALTHDDWATRSNADLAVRMGCTTHHVAVKRHSLGAPPSRHLRWDAVTDWTAPLKTIAAQAGSTIQGASYQRRKRLAR